MDFLVRHIFELGGWHLGNKGAYLRVQIFRNLNSITKKRITKSTQRDRLYNVGHRVGESTNIVGTVKLWMPNFKAQMPNKAPNLNSKKKLFYVHGLNF
jgi:hypothetical protein